MQSQPTTIRRRNHFHKNIKGNIARNLKNKTLVHTNVTVIWVDPNARAYSLEQLFHSETTALCSKQIWQTFTNETTCCIGCVMTINYIMTSPRILHNSSLTLFGLKLRGCRFVDGWRVAGANVPLRAGKVASSGTSIVGRRSKPDSTVLYTPLCARTLCCHLPCKAVDRLTVGPCGRCLSGAR